MRITKALPALVLLLALVAGTASAYISENPRQGLAPISAESHLEPTAREPGPLLGFELRFLGFCIRSGLIYIDPYGQSPSLILALLAELGFMTEFEKTAAEQAWSQAQIQYQLTQVIKDIKKREGENPCDPKLDPLKNVKAGLEDLLSQSKKPGNFDPSLHEDQQDDDWYFHWDKAPHDKRGGGPHWDRGNKKTGRQEWSPDGINWYKK